MDLKCIIIYLFVVQIIVYDWSKTNQILEQYQLDGAYPSAVLRISNSTANLHSYTVGYLSKQSSPFYTLPMKQDTIFDIASLTKITATLTCLMHLYDNNQINIYDKVIKYIPEYGKNGKQNTTLQNLLLHNAGLLEDHPQPVPASKERIMDYIYNCQPSYPIGTAYEYSDLGFVILAQIAERVTRRSLKDYSKLLLDQIGLKNTAFLPNLAQVGHMIAPTEYSPYRRGLIRGVVDDLTAYIFGGVAGDAGIFSVAKDLETFMQFHLQNGMTKQKKQLFKPSTISKFYTRVQGLPYNNSRALGWDTVPQGQFPPCGHLVSQQSFGHTGYTGTMMWADKKRDLIVVLLTNRIHPTDIDITIRKVRSLVMDSIVSQYDRYNYL